MLLNSESHIEYHRGWPYEHMLTAKCLRYVAGFSQHTHGKWGLSVTALNVFLNLINETT